MSNFAPSNGGLPLTVTNPGKQFWVNSSSVLAKNGVGGVSTAKGSYTRPVATINQALDLCLADRGDVIYVMPGYTEVNTATGSSGFTLDVAGVAIVGLGSGAEKPTITHTHASGDVNITGANTSIFNFRFVSGVANMTNFLDITAGDVTIDSCEFRASAATTAILTSITSSALAFGLTVKNCIINMESDVVGVAVSDVAVQGISFDGDNTTIIDNFITGNYSVTGILNVTTAAEGCIVARNKIHNVSTTAAAGGISVKTATSGLAFENNIFVAETSTVIGLMINASLLCFENYAGNVVTEAAALIPVTAST